MRNIDDVLNDVCREVQRERARSLRAMRVDRRRVRALDTEVLSPDQATLHSLNQIVVAAVRDARPIFDALSVPLQLDIDWRVPAVPMLVRPVEDVLAAMLDMCLDPDGCDQTVIRMGTLLWHNRAVALVERRVRSVVAQPWHDLGVMGRVEMIIGDRTSRALGGRLRLQGRTEELRLRLELPMISRSSHAWAVGEMLDCVPARTLSEGLELPGAGPTIGGYR